MNNYLTYENLCKVIKEQDNDAINYILLKVNKSILLAEAKKNNNKDVIMVLQNYNVGVIHEVPLINEAILNDNSTKSIGNKDKTISNNPTNVINNEFVCKQCCKFFECIVCDSEHNVRFKHRTHSYSGQLGIDMACRQYHYCNDCFGSNYEDDIWGNVMIQIERELV